MLQLPIFQTQGFTNKVLARAVLPLLLLLSACQKEEPLIVSDKTIIVYMVADNNLDYFAEKDINEMEQAWNDNFAGNLIVYVDRADGASPSHPMLLKIQHDTIKDITSQVINIYPERNSCDKEHIRSVLLEIIAQYPAKTYGLILWSHGTAWLPAGYSIHGKEQIFEKDYRLSVFKSFGRDNDNEIEIGELIDALPIRFNYIIFDACFMGSVEVVYELKDKTDYLLVSPTEILSYGYPYQQTIPLLFETTLSLNKVADTYFSFYNEKNDYQKTATVSLINTSYLSDLKQICQSIISQNTKIVNIETLQQFETTKNNLFFDLDSYFKQISDTLEYAKFRNILKKTVEYKRHTENIYSILPIINYSGLSIFIPSSGHADLDSYYQKLKWNE